MKVCIAIHKSSRSGLKSYCMSACILPGEVLGICGSRMFGSYEKSSVAFVTPLQCLSSGTISYLFFIIAFIHGNMAAAMTSHLQ